MVDIEKLLELYPDFNKVYGPYERKDGRKHLILYKEGNRFTLSYPKALVEISIGRRLTNIETVDHHDRDFRNNDLSNLKILNRKDHCALDAIRRVVPKMNCSLCGTEFELTKHQIYEDPNKAGPFCTKSCAGKYGKMIQDGLVDKYNRQFVPKEYYIAEKD